MISQLVNRDIIFLKMVCNECHAYCRERSLTCPCCNCIVKAMCEDEVCDIWIDWYFNEKEE